MRFDDRLTTVLNQPVSDPHDTAVRWRQLVELVARAGADSIGPVVEHAIKIIHTDAAQVEDRSRAAAARAVAALPLPFPLLCFFASEKLSVSAPILAAASIDEERWRILFEAADAETRRFIAALHPAQFGAAEPVGETRAAEPLAPAAAAAPSLHQLVERIERRQRVRQREAPPTATDAAPPCLFRWECGPGGQISWVEGAPRGPLIGRSLARTQDGEGHRVEDRVSRAFMLRAPFHDAELRIADVGTVAGEWKISGVPAFDPADGRFAGYRGIALRERTDAAAGQDLLSNADAVRELVHEIKTPLNAIMGFAEIIDAQLLGPAGEGYRERAAEIVRQARFLLSAINDLDLTAKLKGDGSAVTHSDVGELLEKLAPQLREVAAEREVGLDFSPSRGLRAAIEPELAERLIRRVIINAIEDAAPAQVLRIGTSSADQTVDLVVGGRVPLRGRSEEGFFRDGRWRLARGLAGMCGGSISLTKDAITVTFPPA